MMMTFFLLADAPNAFLGWQNMASPIGEELVYFHDIFMWLAISICTLVFALVALMSQKSLFALRRFNHDFTLEVVWTLAPALILLALAFPSFKLLYMMDAVKDTTLTVKAIGHQWYWTYEVTHEGISNQFDSYMVPLDDLEEGSLRLLEVDNRLVLPWGNYIKLIVTASDVIHSWALPALGVKVDAIPGRLNGVAFHCNRMGSFYGQCSELCGTNHAFMPIVVEAVPLAAFLVWAQAL